ncbi:hypothetical protein NDU88_006218 [Pleurodeles waltl]|uniref:Uncharacterized protein n=1 Tax=Pleurodeles waltl TaxID=8319 RepID=A0AAV7MYJ2_PLEWA|nr:hypothetical protein NDU88_006218 [Pleurodeles waltl]
MNIRTPLRRRKWHKLKATEFINSLEKKRPGNLNTNNITNFTHSVNKWIEDSLEEIIPLSSTKKLPRKKSAPWFNASLLEKKRECRKQEKKWRYTQDDSVKREYKNMIRAYPLEIKKAQATYYSDKIEAAANSPKEIFNALKDLIHPIEEPETMDSPQQHVEDLASFFLCKIQDIYVAFPNQRSCDDEPGG